jgi:DNA-directed RNA polymerase specialized sigma24 family protein
MTDKNGVSIYFDGLRDGDSVAINAIWEQYFPRLVRYANQRFKDIPQGPFDKEDAALNALHSFFQGMKDDKFSKVDDRHDLWKLLATITARKVSHWRRYAGRIKRGGGEGGVRTINSGPMIENVKEESLTPDEEVQCQESVDELLDSLGDESLREVALMKMHGYTNAEISEQIDRCERAVERKLAKIREIWLQHLAAMEPAETEA